MRLLCTVFFVKMTELFYCWMRYLFLVKVYYDDLIKGTHIQTALLSFTFTHVFYTHILSWVLCFYNSSELEIYVCTVPIYSGNEGVNFEVNVAFDLFWLCYVSKVIVVITNFSENVWQVNWCWRLIGPRCDKIITSNIGKKSHDVDYEYYEDHEFSREKNYKAL